MQIVLARLNEEKIVAKEGRVDLGERHKMKTVFTPSAMMWLRDGTESDAAKAEAFAAREGYTVFCFTGERDPLERAKREVAAA